MQHLKYPKSYEANLKHANEVLDAHFQKYNVKYEGTDPVPDAKKIFFKT